MVIGKYINKYSVLYSVAIVVSFFHIHSSKRHFWQQERQLEVNRAVKAKNFSIDSWLPFALSGCCQRRRLLAYLSNLLISLLYKTL